MLTLITGGCKSGKSAIAEAVAASYGLPLYYIATMEPWGGEAEAVIKRHLEQRAGKGFVTVERYTDIGSAPVSGVCCALVEDIANLLANEMFSAKAPDPAEKIIGGTVELYRRTANLVIVTNEVGCDSFSYPPETEEYIKLMGEINRRLAEMADTVIEAVFGIPLILKGERPKCL